MESLQDKAIIYVPDNVDILEELETAAKSQFPYTFSTKAKDGTTLVTIYAPRLNRIPFQNFINEAVASIGKQLEPLTVLVEVNGTLGVYERGKDYE